MDIDFNLIPVSLLVPGVFVEIDESKASSGPTIQVYRALILAQKTAAGTAPKDIPVALPNAEDANALFGEGSMAARMAQQFRDRNLFTNLDVIPLDDDAAGVLAAGTFTFVGTATAAGTIFFYIGGERLTAAVAVGDDMSAVAAAVAASIAAAEGLPVTGSSTLGVTTITAKNKGTIGNSIDLRVNYNPGEALPAGITVTVAAMTGGATDPVLTAAIVAMGETQYNVIAFPYTDTTSLTAIEAELLDRWGPLRAIDGVAIAASQDTIGNLQTLGNARNSQFVSILGLDSFPGIPAERAAQVAGLVAFFGASDPARPFQTLRLSGLPPAEIDRFTVQERNLLLEDGISTLVTGPGGAIQINRLVTTRTKNDSGFADTAFRDVNDVLQLGFYRFSWATRMALRFPRHKLAEKISGTLDGGQNVLTEMGAKTESIAHYGELEAIGIVQDPRFFADNTFFEISATDPNRLNGLLAPRLTGQARVIAGKVQFRE